MFKYHSFVCLPCVLDILDSYILLIDFFVPQILFFSKVLLAGLSADPPMLYHTVAQEISFSLNLSIYEMIAYINALYVCFFDEILGF